MPASPSLPTDGRGKWKRQKRHRRAKTQTPNNIEDDDNDEPLTDNNNENSDTNPHSTELPEVVSDGFVRVSEFPSMVKRVVNRPHSLVTAVVEGSGQCVSLENLSYGQLQAKSVVGLADCLGFDQDGGSIVRPPRVLEAKGVVKRFGGRVHVVPMHSEWFSPSSVHRIERQVVPHFFSGKSPDHSIEKYIECRNHIVAKYMENPGKKLTVTNCQGLVTGVGNEDVNRIFRFLESWGIINYCSDVSNHGIVNTESFLKEDPNGEIHVSTSALKSIDGLIIFDRPTCKLKAAEIYSSSSSAGDVDLENKLWERFSENYCHNCSRPVPLTYYQSQKEVDVVLCSHCFHEGRFVTGHSSLDFVRIDSIHDYGDQDGDSWSDQETLLLLEAIEMYNDNWNEIADHVGSKSKAQCILHFLRLPMEDGPLESIDVPGKSVSPNALNRDDRERSHAVPNGNSKGSYHEDVDSESSLPFTKSANPVMTLVAFLTSAVGPRISAACAQAALAVLSEDDGSSIRQEGHAKRMNPETICVRDGGSHGEITNSIQQKEEGLSHGSRSQNGADIALLSAEKVKAAVRAGINAAAMKAKMFADHEEREIQRLSANIINQQLRRLEMKLKQSAELETLLMKECEQVERTRQRLAAERARIMSAKFGSTGAALPAGLSSSAPAIVNNAASNRQQVMSSSTSQASISGYTGQPIHPHMSFMPRQQSQLYGFGPRLPLTAIQSSTTPPNVMFNPQGNTRPAVNNPMLRHMSGASSGLN